MIKFSNNEQSKLEIFSVMVRMTGMTSSYATGFISISVVDEGRVLMHCHAVNRTTNCVNSSLPNF